MHPNKITDQDINDLLKAIEYIDKNSSVNACHIVSSFLNDHLGTCVAYQLLDIIYMLESYADRLFDDENKK